MRAKVTIASAEPTKEALQNVYDVCNRLFNSKEVFYNSDQVKALKKDKANIWLG